MSELSIFIEHSDLNLKTKETNLANPSTLLQAEMGGGGGGKACAHAARLLALARLLSRSHSIIGCIFYLIDN